MEFHLLRVMEDFNKNSESNCEIVVLKLKNINIF